MGGEFGKGRTARGKLSTDPHNIRYRLRRKTARVDEELQMLCESAGYKPVDEWSLEELAKGKPRNADGTWRNGVSPKWITPKIQAEVKRRLIEVGQQTLAAQLGPAIKLMKDLMRSTETDAFGRPLVDSSTKLAAAKFIVEQVLGKAKQKIELGTDESFRSFLAGALVLPSGEEAHPVIDGQFTEEEEEGDDDDG